MTPTQDIKPSAMPSLMDVSGLLIYFVVAILLLRGTIL